ncbi:MAG: TetR/AcrR family transcriptional regulator [Acidimicrobiia bacterium]|nr:TetR/AcrR family transcriptional regulator [Acidimicrobiia bacterium]
MTAARTYRSPLRDEQARRTRDLILDSLVDLVAAEGAAELSIRDLADRAGVSERTVYRHFPDRAALLDGLADHVAERLGWVLHNAEIETLDEFVDAIPASFASFDEHEAHTRALVLLNLDPARVASLTRRNQEMLRQAVADELDHLDADEKAEAVAVLHLLASSRTWLRFREQDGLAPGQASRAAQRAARAVLADLRDCAPRPSAR